MFVENLHKNYLLKRAKWNESFILIILIYLELERTWWGHVSMEQ